MVDEEELRAERDANIKGVPEIKREWAIAPKCKGCIDKVLNTCFVCKNWGICHDKSRKPDCWVANKCDLCEQSR